MWQSTLPSSCGVRDDVSGPQCIEYHETLVSRKRNLSAVIFNALIIVALIPLALKGVKYRPVSAVQLLRRHLLIYGVGGVVAPFVGIS